MASKILSGQMTGTGVAAASTVTCNRALIDIDFSSTGTVLLEWCVDGANWKPYGSYTADQHLVVDFGVNVPIRLNCSVYAAAIDWSIRV